MLFDFCSKTVFPFETGRIMKENGPICPALCYIRHCVRQNKVNKISIMFVYCILGLRILGGSVFSVYTGFHEIKKKLRHLVIVYVCKSVREDLRQFPWSGFPRYFDYR